MAVNARNAGSSGNVTTKTPYPQPANEVQWADDLLTYINAPVNDQSLAFITAAEINEGVFYASAEFIPRKYGDDNANNPLDSTQFEAGGVVWAENGGDPVWQFPTLQAGLASNASILEDNPGNLDLLADLRKGNKTMQELAADIAASDWGTGGGPGSAAEVGYSATISGLLQEALGEIPAGFAVKGPTGVLTSWTNPFGGGGKDPLNWPTEILGKLASGPEKAFVGGFEAILPDILMILGVIVGGGLIVLGAYKAAGRKPSEVPGVGAIINVVKKNPELAVAGA
jgi:hypothetical protein